MTIVRNERATLKFEEGSIVVARAFELNGVYHDIVVSDGDCHFDKNHLKGAKAQAIRKTIQDIFFQSIQRAMAPDTALNAPLETVRFVYKKNQSSTDTDNVQLFVHKPDAETDPAPFQIGTPEINQSMLEFNKIFGTLGPAKTEKESPVSKTSKPTGPVGPHSATVSSAAASSSVIPAPPKGSPSASNQPKPAGAAVQLTQAQLQRLSWVLQPDSGSSDEVVPAPPRPNGNTPPPEADGSAPAGKCKSWRDTYKILPTGQKRVFRERVGKYFADKAKAIFPGLNGDALEQAIVGADEAAS